MIREGGPNLQRDTASATVRTYKESKVDDILFDDFSRTLDSEPQRLLFGWPLYNWLLRSFSDHAGTTSTADKAAFPERQLKQKST